jgi:Tfp pilus assembly protein PilV
MTESRLAGRRTAKPMTTGLGGVRQALERRRNGIAPDERGLSLIEVVMASVILMIAVFSLTDVLINSMVQTAYSRQQSEATNLANQTMEEVRALPWAAIQAGMNPVVLPDATFSPTVDPNLSSAYGGNGYCFEGSPIDVASVVTSSSCPSATSWQDPTCLAQAATVSPPGAGSIGSPAPISPHQACYLVGSFSYGVDVYITGTTGESSPPSTLTGTVVVTWRHPYVHGVADDVVTSTVLTPCTKGGDTSCGL